MKNLQGKTVYLRPTGNNAGRGSKKMQEATLLKVAKVFVTLVFAGSNYERRMRFSGFTLNEGCNSGYEVYEKEQDLLDYYESTELASAISDRCRYRPWMTDVSLKNLRTIANIIGVYKE